MENKDVISLLSLLNSAGVSLQESVVPDEAGNVKIQLFFLCYGETWQYIYDFHSLKKNVTFPSKLSTLTPNIVANRCANTNTYKYTHTIYLVHIV